MSEDRKMTTMPVKRDGPIKGGSGGEDRKFTTQPVKRGEGPVKQRPVMSNQPVKRRPDHISSKLASMQAVGNRIYKGGSSSPHVGKGSVNPAGYKERDQKADLKKNRLIARMKARKF